MRWTIGMPSYNNFTEVYFTIQSLRLHHDLRDCEIVVIDNFGDPVLEEFCRVKGSGVVRYVKYTDVQGVSPAKNKIFEVARGENVLVMDSHILLKQGALNFVPENDDLIQGPLMLNTMDAYYLEWLPKWNRNMWGVWADSVKQLPDKPFEIWATGAGFFACKRDSWLGFNKDFRGFGGETGYIQEKYRQAGRKVWCHPAFVWVHYFCNGGRKIPFPCQLLDRVRNYILGFKELGMELTDIKEHFGENTFNKALANIASETAIDNTRETSTILIEEVR